MKTKSPCMRLSRGWLRRFVVGVIGGVGLLNSGCGMEDADRPLDRVPNVPPATRDTGGDSAPDAPR